MRGDAYDPTAVVDCDAIDGAPGAPGVEPRDRRFCRMLRYFDPAGDEFASVYPQRHPVFLANGAQDEPWTVGGFQETFRVFSREVPVFRHLRADLDHAHYFGFMSSYESYSNIMNFCYESRPGRCRDPFGREFSMNELYRSVAVFFYSLVRGEPYAAVPSRPRVEERPGSPSAGDTTYRLTSCWDALADPSPAAARFDVSLDRFWHILPACDNGTFLPGAEFTYVLADRRYRYNAACKFKSGEGYWVFPNRCVGGAEVEPDGGRGIVGRRMRADEIVDLGEDPAEKACAEAFVVFEGIRRRTISPPGSRWSSESKTMSIIPRGT
ncbi:MAG: hypothetical protein M5R36_15360 [Deltaproteobacteria bacterium]|nr:hypothetical protein [Deltaproteobacteria bacterium]